MVGKGITLLKSRVVKTRRLGLKFAGNRDKPARKENPTKDISIQSRNDQEGKRKKACRKETCDVILQDEGGGE